MSTDEFRAEANAICAESARSLRELPPPEDTAAGVAEYADGAAPILDARRDRLAALRPPETSAAAFEELLRQADAEVEALRGVRDAALDDDQAAAATAFGEGRTATAAFNRAAQRLELGDCVRRPASG